MNQHSIDDDVEMIDTSTSSKFGSKNSHDKPATSVRHESVPKKKLFSHSYNVESLSVHHSKSILSSVSSHMSSGEYLTLHDTYVIFQTYEDFSSEYKMSKTRLNET